MLAQHDGIERARVRCLGTWDPLCGRAIAQLLRRFDPNLVQTHMARASALGGKAARSAGYPTLAILHNMIKLKYYRSIDLFVPTTMDQERYLHENGIPEDRIERIPHFRSIEAVGAARVPKQGSGVVKALGRLVHEKGFDLLLYAAGIAAQRGTAFELQIGGAGPEGDALKELAERLGIGGQVHFPGWINDVAGYLADADVFVLPSRREAFGIVVLEAMACGIPIVATRTSGPDEILDEQTALLVPPDNPEALAEAVRAVFDAPNEAKLRANAALDSFVEQYSESVIIDRYIESCKRLVSISE